MRFKGLQRRRLDTYINDSMLDLPRSEAKARWKSGILSLMRYETESNCCLRNWIALVLPVLNAFFKRPRTCKNQKFARFRMRATYGRDVVDGGCGVRENTELRFTLGVGVIGHFGSPATVDKTRNVFVRVSQTGGNKTCRLVMVNSNTLS